jgi:hypothetical protein
MKRTPFSVVQLQDKLATQLRFLDASILAYDAGDEAESLRMAVSVRVLAHHVRKSPALLAQVGPLHTLSFPNTGKSLGSSKAIRNKRKITVHAGPSFRLVTLSMSTESIEFKPKLDELIGAARVGYVEWWKTRVLRHRGILPEATSWELSRMDVVLGLANREGGTHVDPNPSFNWWVATRSGAYGSLDRSEKGELRVSWPLGDVTIGEAKGTIITPVHATMRVIAAELRIAVREVHNL